MSFIKWVIFQLLIFLSIISQHIVTSQCTGCQDLKRGLSYTEFMIEGKSEISGTGCNKTITCTSTENSPDSIVSLTIDHFDGYTVEAGNGFGKINLDIYCKNGTWYMFEFVPLKNVFYCEATPVNLTTSTATTQRSTTQTSTTSVTTSSTTILPQCASCQALQAGPSYTVGMIEGKSEISGTGCNKTITCYSKQNNPNSFISITIAFLNGSKAEASFGMGSAKLNMSCKNGNWFLSDYDLVTLKNIYYCEATPTDPASPLPINLTSTTITKSSMTSTTSSTSMISTSPTTATTTTTQSVTSSTTKPVVSAQCNITSGFQLVSASVDPSTSKFGKFGGYFQSRSSCEELCYQNYGLLVCNVYMYEPQKSGKCTIFEYLSNDKIIQRSNSTASVFKKCNGTDPTTTSLPATSTTTSKMSTSTTQTTTTFKSTTPKTTTSTTPIPSSTSVRPLTTSAVPRSCCPALVQSLTSTVLADGTMSFAYKNDTCRSAATITCQQPQRQGLELQAAIVVDQVNFIDVNYDTVTFPATCNNGVWLISEPPLPITSVQCVLTDPV